MIHYYHLNMTISSIFSYSGVSNVFYIHHLSFQISGRMPTIVARMQTLLTCLMKLLHDMGLWESRCQRPYYSKVCKRYLALEKFHDIICGIWWNRLFSFLYQWFYTELSLGPENNIVKISCMNIHVHNVFVMISLIHGSDVYIVFWIRMDYHTYETTVIF